MAINTKAVVGRRKLRFNSLDEILVDLNGLEGRKLKTLGNWTVGQNLAHLAIPMTSAIDGMQFRPAWYFRLMGRFVKRWMLKGSMSPGFKLPKAGEAELVPGLTSEAEGFPLLRRAIGRLKTETHREPNNFLGRLTIDEWNQLMCRHCELHLSFIVPEV